MKPRLVKELRDSQGNIVENLNRTGKTGYFKKLRDPKRNIGELYQKVPEGML